MPLQHDRSIVGRLPLTTTVRPVEPYHSRRSLARLLPDVFERHGNGLRAGGLRPLPGPRAGFHQNDSLPLAFRSSWRAHPVRPASGNVTYLCEAFAVLEGHDVARHLGDDPIASFRVSAAGEMPDRIVIMPMRI